MIMHDLIRGMAEVIERKTQLELENEKLKATMVDSEKFYSVPMTLEVAGSLHGVSAKVLRRLVSLGLIPLHPSSTDAKILIRASEAIKLDLEDLKEKAKHLSYV